ncbi:MAG: hypothetical protein WCV84_06070 [Patescibacteria group bacterium]
MEQSKADFEALTGGWVPDLDVMARSVDMIQMARMVYRHFGCNVFDATPAWNRLLQSSITEADFLELIDSKEEL